MSHKTIENNWSDMNEAPRTTVESYKLSKNLKSRGMIFVESKIIYSYMQSVGMFNDHVQYC
jgi:DNA-3-methyladenine glycosylase I